MRKKLKRSKINIVIITSVIFILILGYIVNTYIIKPDSTIENKDLAIKKCKELCILENSQKSINEDGPCLSNEIVAGWACDIAHDPRLSYIDNKKVNQCDGHFDHFVELTRNCKFIRAK